MMKKYKQRGDSWLPGFRGGEKSRCSYKRVTKENPVVMELFCMLAVVVVTRVYT